MATQEQIDTLIKPLLDTREVAEMFGVTPFTIQSWRDNNGMPFLRIPGGRQERIRFDPEAVQQWHDERHKKEESGERVRL